MVVIVVVVVVAKLGAEHLFFLLSIGHGSTAFLIWAAVILTRSRKAKWSPLLD